MKRNQTQFVMNPDGTMVPAMNTGVQMNTPFDPQAMLAFMAAQQGGFFPQGFVPQTGAPAQGNAAQILKLRSDATDGDSAGKTDPFWYLKHEGLLSAVTGEKCNPAVGINDISVYNPNANQAAAGIVCKVTLDTVVGKFNNVSVMSSKFAPGAIRLVLPSHQGANDKWYTDYSLTEGITAQVLSYVDTLIQK